MENTDRALSLEELEQHEKIAFGCLVRMMIRSDGHFSDEEEELINSIGEAELGGAGELWHLISASAAVFPDEKNGKGELSKVKRPEARALILKVLEGLAGSDGLERSEAELLSWVRSQWK
ncbi:MAG: hypothetical protein RBU30_18965 [Polyangia bacterium]|jgi:hypothetical protein|nr:hypothetical protein [Polyangia bacterium]